MRARPSVMDPTRRQMRCQGASAEPQPRAWRSSARTRQGQVAVHIRDPVLHDGSDHCHIERAISLCVRRGRRSRGCSVKAAGSASSEGGSRKSCQQAEVQRLQHCKSVTVSHSHAADFKGGFFRVGRTGMYTTNWDATRGEARHSNLWYLAGRKRSARRALLLLRGGVALCCGPVVYIARA